MDAYELELQNLRAALTALRLDDNADVALITEYEMELRNLTALFNAASVTYEAGIDEPRLPAVLSSLGFGVWTFVNVYGFVYDAAMDADLEGGDLASLVDSTDYVASLLLAEE